MDTTIPNNCQSRQSRRECKNFQVRGIFPYWTTNFMQQTTQLNRAYPHCQMPWLGVQFPEIKKKQIEVPIQTPKSLCTLLSQCFWQCMMCGSRPYDMSHIRAKQLWFPYFQILISYVANIILDQISLHYLQTQKGLRKWNHVICLHHW